MAKEGGSSSSTSTSSAASGGQISSADNSFVKGAAEGGMAEVRMGELGDQKASNSQVRDLAKRLQEDHQKANDELQNLAKSKGIDLPTSMGASKQTMISDLESKQSPEFDREFVQQAIKDHQKDIAQFERASHDLSDSEFKSWAEKTLPVLKEHLRLAEQARDSLGKGGSSSGGMEK
jgi:putative membrane protein